MSALLDWALFYAVLGWKVLPLHWWENGRCSCGEECSSPAKHPLTKNGLKDATDNEATVREWWIRNPNANIGIATGAVSGIVVLDVDVKGGGKESFISLDNPYEIKSTAVTSMTGGGGNHYIWLHPGKEVRNSASKLGSGLDVRGDGGYIVAPPSNHASGNEYVWMDSRGPDQKILEECPKWLVEAMTAAKKTPRQEPQQPPLFTPSESGNAFLGKALAKATDGNRNEQGMWLACQLRDCGLSEYDAKQYMLSYADRVPQGESRYLESEAIATLRSAYSRSARSAPESATRTSSGWKPKRDDGIDMEPDITVIEKPRASLTLGNHLDGIIDGTIQNVAWPWKRLTEGACSLLPGCMTQICGDPGVGKTFWILQALRFWTESGIQASAFFVEKDEKFHAHRLLAQLEGNGEFVNYDWIPANKTLVLDAMARHAAEIDVLGERMFSAPNDRLTMRNMLKWIENRAKEGDRVIVVDPITAVDAGSERWMEDQRFMIGCQRVANDNKASVVLVTHPKGGVQNKPSMHSAAGGAAYSRFADTLIWLKKEKKGKKIRVNTDLGMTIMTNVNIVAEMHKTRNGKMSGWNIAYVFGSGLEFREEGYLSLSQKGTEDEDEDGTNGTTIYNPSSFSDSEQDQQSLPPDAKGSGSEARPW